MSAFLTTASPRTQPPSGAAASFWRTPNGAVLLLILGTALLRIGFGTVLGLGVDESYMVAAGRHLQLGYFDHPPAAWWLTWAATQLTGTEAAPLVRLPFILLFAVSTWLMHRLTSRLYGPRAGLWATVALNLSPVFAITTGGWVLPDGPLDCALLGAVLCLSHALEGGARARAWWLGAGLAAGLALFSKYQAGLTLLGALVYLLTQPAHRHWLRRLDPWLAALVALVAFLPVLAWNATHGWSSFAFQGGRAAAGSWHPFAPLLVLGGEALFVLPWIWLPMMACLLGALRRGPAVAPDWLFSCLALPPILLFAAVSVWSPHVLFHWAAPGYLMLFPLLGRQLAAWTTQPRSRRFVRFGLGATVALGALSAGIIGSEILWRWAPDPAGDLSLQAMDWRALGPALDRRGLGDAVLAGIRWHECGKLGYALGRHKTVLCLTPDAREFAFSTHPARHDGSDVLIVTPHGTLAAVTDQLGNRFDQIDPLPPVTLENGGRPALEFSLFLGRGLH